MSPALLFALLAPAALAQDSADQSVDFELFRPVGDRYGYLSTPSAATLRNLELGLGLWVNYSADPVVLELEGEQLPLSTANGGDGVVDSRLMTHFQVGMGLGRYFSLGVDLPLVGAQTGTDPSQVNVVNATPDALQSAGLGDLRLIPRFVALNRDDAPIGLALTVPVGLPTGNDSLVGEGGLSLAPSLSLELSDGPIHGREYKVRGLLSGGYRIRPDDRLRDVYVGDQAEFAAAFGWHFSEPVELMLDFHGAVGGSLPAQRPGELLLGSRFYVGDFLDLHLGGGTGVMPGLGSPDWRVVAGLTFAPVFDPALRDSDKDGVADGRDQCKMELEDRDGFKDEDGCPENDNDKDQITDDKDKCPNDPEDDDGYNDEDGCPEPDNDADGIPDMNDHCPVDPESMNGHADMDGCPDEAPTGNSDGDAFMDDVDRCPYDAEDVDGYADEDGCPEPDNDNDGIADKMDRCPNQREIINGVDDEDGCPEDQRVVVEKDKIRITEVIYFDTGKATIQSRSHSLLDEIASTIQANPNIKKIRIEGHTDAQGNDAANLKLSQARAESVRSYLISKGVAAARLDARGFGESYPIAPNETEAGRSQNRRVEFMITDKD